MLKAGGCKIFVSLFILFLQTVLYCANTENVCFILNEISVETKVISELYFRLRKVAGTLLLM